LVYVERSERRIPVQYAKRIVGRRVMGRTIHALASEGQRRWRHAGHFRFLDHHPAQMVFAAFKDNRFVGPVLEWLKFGEPLYTLLYAWASFLRLFLHLDRFQPERRGPTTCVSMAGSFRYPAGKRTGDFINAVLTRLTLVGALYLIIISFIPE